MYRDDVVLPAKYNLNKNNNNNFHNQYSLQTNKQLRVKPKTFTKLQSISHNFSHRSNQSNESNNNNQNNNTSNSNPISFTFAIQSIKKLLKQWQFKQALIQIKSLYSKHKQNLVVLELLANCLYNLEQYKESIKVCEKIFQLISIQSKHKNNQQQNENISQIYIICSLSHAKLKQHEQSLQILQNYQSNFISKQNPDIFYYKAKILYHMKKYQKAIQSFYTAYKISKLSEIILCILDCYRKSGEREKILQVVNEWLEGKEKVIVKQKYKTKVERQDQSIYEQLILRKCGVLYEMGRLAELQEYIQGILILSNTINNNDNIKKNINLTQNIKQKAQSSSQLQSSQQSHLLILSSTLSPLSKLQLQYIHALIFFKLQNYQKSFQIFQDILINSQKNPIHYNKFYIKSIKMLILINILEKKYYEASYWINIVIEKNGKINNEEDQKKGNEDVISKGKRIGICYYNNNQNLNSSIINNNNTSQTTNPSQSSDTHLQMLTKFVQGSINLIRRNFKQGLQILSHLQISIQKLQQNLQRKKSKISKQNNLFDYLSYQDIQSISTIKFFIHLFMSYGLFSIGQFSLCKTAIKKQLGLFDQGKKSQNKVNNSKQHIKNLVEYKKGLQYNFKLCQAIQAYQYKLYRVSFMKLQQAKQFIGNEKLEIYFYQAVVLIQIYFDNLDNQDQHGNNKEENIQILSKIKQSFNQASNKVSPTSNNTKATILYYKSILHSYLQEWKHALTYIDQSIQKSDDQYWRYHYVRAMILSSVHSFEEAINDLDIAINLSQRTKAECFLLRSKCYQIQGKGHEAFYDLQQYIALKPEDSTIHKYAGQLLFENGAFQDALIALEHEKIQKVYENYETFLTTAKTHFLMGNFKKSYQNMQIASQLKQSQLQVKFDAKSIQFLSKLIELMRENNSLKIIELDLLQQLQKLFNRSHQPKLSFGRIFSSVDYYLFKFIIHIYSQKYSLAAQCFSILLKQKIKLFIAQQSQNNLQIYFLQTENESGTDYFEKNFDHFPIQLKIYSNQIKYNIGICYLANGDIQKCNEVLSQIKIQKDEGFYEAFNKFKEMVKKEKFERNLYNGQSVQIFPNKNKLSQFLPHIHISLSLNNTQPNFSLPLCLTFPKVQPPQIFPSFDKSLLRSLSLYGIQNKPQAPWITKQDNVIKFTQKIQHFSRLDCCNDSQNNNQSRQNLLQEDKQKYSKYQIIKMNSSYGGDRNNANQSQKHQKISNKNNINIKNKNIQKRLQMINVKNKSKNNNSNNENSSILFKKRQSIQEIIKDKFNF